MINMITNPDLLFRHAFLLGLGIGSLGLIAPHETIAQETAAGEEIAAPPVEVSAYRVPTLLSETSQGVSIVTREEIAGRNAASAMDVLRDIPGLYVDQVGGAGGVSTIHIRGSDPEQVLVVVNGVRLNDPMLSRGGSYDLSSLDTADIERIEVIRGAGSAIYGADSMGGVINIVTRKGKPEAFSGSAGIEAGGQRYEKIKGSVVGGSEVVSYAANASRLKDGRDADGSSLELSTFSGSLSFRPLENAGIEIFARHNERESTSFPDDSGGIRFAVTRTLELRDANETSFGTNISTDWDWITFKINLSRYERDEDINSPGVVPGPGLTSGIPPNVSKTEFTRDNELISASFRLPRNSDLTLGYEHLHEVGKDRTVLDFGFPFPSAFDLKRSTDSVFGELKTEPIADLILKFDLRNDSVSKFGSKTSPSAGARYTLSDAGSVFKIRYTEGFRPPSFFALGNPLVGDPNLIPETSKGYEAGVEQSFLDNKAHVGLTLFRTKYKNLIVFDDATDKMVNRNNVDAQGTELDMSLRTIDNLNLGANYTYVHTRIADSSEELRNRPRHRASLSARYSMSEAWQLSLSTTYVGQFFGSSAPTDVIKLDSYTRTDISTSYQCKRLTATIAVDNLFGEKYEQFVGFAHPGARIRAGLSASF
jgi:vitamin B12 transporter